MPDTKDRSDNQAAGENLSAGSSDDLTNQKSSGLSRDEANLLGRASDSLSGLGSGGGIPLNNQAANYDDNFAPIGDSGESAGSSNFNTYSPQTKDPGRYSFKNPSNRMKSGRSALGAIAADDSLMQREANGGENPEKASILAGTNPTEKAETDKATENAEKGGWRNKMDKVKSARQEGVSNIAKRRAKALVLSAVTTLIVVGIGGIFGFLLPFKLSHIIENIERQVGEVPQYAVERRAEYLMNRFLIIETLKQTGVPDVDTNREYTYLGNGVVSTLYTNWKGAKLDAAFQQKGFRIEPIQQESGFTDRKKFTRPSNFRLIENGKVIDGNLNSKAARGKIKKFTRDQTKWHQVIKRFHMRFVYKKYNGVSNWKIFETKREKVRESYFDKKLKLKQYTVKQTVGRVSENYGKYLNCLLEGGDKCKEIRDGDVDDRDGDSPEDQDDNEKSTQDSGEEGSKKAADDPNVKSYGDDAAKALGEGTDDEIAGRLDNAASKTLGQSIKDQGLKRILASFAGGVALVHGIFQIEKSVSDGSLSVVAYDKNMQEYAQISAIGQSMEDQFTSGDIDMESVRVGTELYDGYEKSLAYQGTKSDFDASKSYSADCNEDGDTTDKGDLLEPGETICPHKRLVQSKESFTQTEGWQVFAEIGGLWRSSIGIGVAAFNNALSSVMDVTGADSVIAKLIDITGVDSLIQSGFGFLLNRVLGCVVCGALSGDDTWDATYAGMAGNTASIGGGVGKGREDTIGGGYLNNNQVAAIKAEQQDSRKQELEGMSMFARYFSPSVAESLTGQFAVAMPTSMGAFSQSVATGLSTSASTITRNVVSLSTPKSNAAGVVNPFHAIYYGYPTDHEVFTANSNDGMEPGDLADKYGCQDTSKRSDEVKEYVEAMGRPDNLPFDVYLNADPCKLEKVSTESAEMYFTGEFDKGIDDGSDATATSQNQVPGNSKIFVIGDSLTVGMRDGGQLADKLKAAGWDPMPIEAKGGEPLKWGIDTIKAKSAEIKAANPGTIMVNLGTNDVGSTGAAFGAKVDEMTAAIKEIAPSARIFWTNFYGEGSVCFVTCVNLEQSFGEFNGVLDTKSKEKSFSIIPWATSPIAAEFVGINDVHPAKGYPQMAEFVVQSLGAVPSGGSIAGLESPPNLGPAVANNYYAMPDAANGEYVFGGNTPPSDRCGNKALVDVIYTVAKAWRAKYPDRGRVRVGDLNAAAGHVSHMTGVDVDITTEDQQAANVNGDQQKSKDLAQLFADTGIIEKILYNDSAVQNDFNSYTASKGVPGKMQYYDGHANHFHVRILPEYKLASMGACP
jgi:hypothetical protein